MEDRHRLLFELASRRYLSEVQLTGNLERNYSIKVAVYILCCHMALPVKTLIVGERPYSTDIHPPVSSAMSYDERLSKPTPSTLGVASDLCNSLGCVLLEVERWIRDGWKHLGSGTVLVNCTLFKPYTSPYGINETIPFQRWMRCMLECSISMSNSKIDVICMGVPAQNVVEQALGSMGSNRKFVSKKIYPNPAIWSKMSRGDTGSRGVTFERKGTSISILSAIKRSENCRPFTIQDYLSTMSGKQPTQLRHFDRVISTGGKFTDEIEDVFKELEKEQRAATVKELWKSFSDAMLAYRDSMLIDMVSNAVSTSGDISGKVGRATEWGSKKPWNKSAPSVGASTKMSTVSEEVGGVEQKFDDEPTLNSNPPSEEALPHQPEPPKPKVKKMKKVTVKRTVKKPRVASHESEGQGKGAIEEPEETRKGSSINSDGISALRSVMYYASEVDSGPAHSVLEEVRSSIEDQTAKTDRVGLMVDSAFLDLKSKGKDASSTLGIEDGEVDHDCFLPRLMNKLLYS